MSATSVPDPYSALRALEAEGLLRTFNEAGVLSSADVQVAQRLARLAGGVSGEVQLATALAVRAVRLGSVLVELGTISTTASVEADEVVPLESLPWPEPAGWAAAVAASGLAAGSTLSGLPAGLAAGPHAPLVLEGGRLYLARYWRDEVAVAEDLRRRSAATLAPLPGVWPEAGTGVVMDESQRDAVESALSRRLSVIAGGPGTGKTTTIVFIVAMLLEAALAQGRNLPLLALAAPTGKAAARLQEAVREGSAELELSEEARGALEAVRASTLHRLLGNRRGSRTRFRHDREHRLPHDVVIVDETSMVPLPLMARLLEAVRPEAQLVLVGDPGQLTSVEAGAVLGDIVGPAAGGAESGFGSGIRLLARVHRYGGAIGSLAEAVRVGEADRALEILASGAEDVLWLPLDFGAEGIDHRLDQLRARVDAAGEALYAAAARGDAAVALAAARGFMVLCAHRRGPYGVGAATARALGWLARAVPELDPDAEWYLGQPLLVNANDYELQLFNGDTGVVVAGEEGLAAVFQRGGTVLSYSPARLTDARTAYAMTIHKSQGSQFDSVAVILPAIESRILTRELLYTALTRARGELLVVGTEAMLRAALKRPMARASGLRERLWGAQT